MNPNDFLTENESINEAKNKDLQDRTKRQEHKNEISQVLNNISAVGQIVSNAIDKKSNDVKVLNFPTSIKTPDVERLVLEIKALRDESKVKEPKDTTTHDLLGKLLTSIQALPTSMPESKEFPSEFTVKNQKDYDAKLDAVVSAVQAIKMDFQPNITVKPADVKVKETDLSLLEKKLDILTSAVKAISIVVPEQDDSELLKRISATTKAINSLSFPVPNYILPFKKADGSATQALVDDDGKLNVDIDMATEGLATTAKQDTQITSLDNILAELVQKTEATQNQQVELINAIRVLMQATVNPPYLDKSANQTRSQVTGSLTTLTNLTNMGAWSGTQLSYTASQNTWSNMCRSLIT